MLELQNNDKEAKAIRSDVAGLTEDWKNDKGMLQYQSLPYVPEIICFKEINCHHDDLLAEHFGIDKIQELVARKYYWFTLYYNVKTYVQGCNLCLAFKTAHYKPYRDLQLLSVLIDC